MRSGDRPGGGDRAGLRRAAVAPGGSGRSRTSTQPRACAASTGSASGPSGAPFEARCEAQRLRLSRPAAARSSERDVHLRHLRRAVRAHPPEPGGRRRPASGLPLRDRHGFAVGRRARVRAGLARGAGVSQPPVRAARRLRVRPSGPWACATTVCRWSCSRRAPSPTRSTTSRSSRHDRRRAGSADPGGAVEAAVAPDGLLGADRGRDRRGREPARLGPQRLVPQPLEHDHDDLGRVADRRDRS